MQQKFERLAWGQDCNFVKITLLLFVIQMTNFDEYTNENKKDHNLNWPYIPDHPYRILIIGGSGTGKTNALLNLINNQQDIDKIYLYAKDPHGKV